jgi:hypothetical protein
MQQVKIQFHDRQYKAFTSQATEILYGGAAGGGKSFFGRGALIAWCIGIPGLQAYIVRKSYPDLIDNHTKGAGSLPSILFPLIESGQVKYNKQYQEFNFDNGSMIKLLAAQEESDREEIFRGKEIHVLFGDESTLLTEGQISYIRTRIRMDEDTRAKARAWVKATYPHMKDENGDTPDLFPRVIWGTNPTGISHDYFKREFIDERNPEEIWQHEVLVRGKMTAGFSRQYIPARLEDNPSIDFDAYASNIVSDNRPEIAKALLDGDWDVRAAGMFSDVFDRRKHVIQVQTAQAPPEWWKTWSALDWGSTDPYCELWATEATGEDVWLNQCFPRGSIIVFMEAYGVAHDEQGRYLANKGLKESPTEAGRTFTDIEDVYKIDRVGWHFAGADLWNTQRIDGRFYTRALEFEESHGRRYIRAAQGKGSRIQGWELIRSLLKGRSEDGFPELFITSNCKHLIRTLTGLQSSIKIVDDCDSGQEDHAPDCLRYLLSPLFKGKELPPPEYHAEKKRRLEEELENSYRGLGDPLGQKRESWATNKNTIWRD